MTEVVQQLLHMCCTEPKILPENFAICNVPLQKYKWFNSSNYAHVRVIPLVKQEYVYVLSGFGDIWGCGRGFLSGGVGTAEPCPEGPVQACDARELQEPGVTG